MIVSEAFGGAPNAAAVSSYETSSGGSLSVVRGSVPDVQTAACWIVITNNGRYVYTTSTGSGSVSRYQLASNGSLGLINSVAASTGPNSAPIDMALNNSSRFLYVHTAGGRGELSVETDGSLTPLGLNGGLPFSAQGTGAAN